MHLIVKVLESLRKEGVLKTLRTAGRIIADYTFDWKYGTDTMQRVDVESFDTDSGQKIHAQRYQASMAHPLLNLFRILRLPADGVFVDLGSGKGRVLLIASRLGFKRVVGIEFCAQLCRQARKNAELFLKKYPSIAPIEVIESDVTCYDFRGDENIFFLYNPFDSVVLERVLSNITRSVQKAPRDIWLIYNNPVHHRVVQNNAAFAQYIKYDIEGEIFHVYRHHAKK